MKNSRQTDILGRPTQELTRETETLTHGSGQSHIRNSFSKKHITIGTDLNGYIVVGTLSENSGEAAIFLCEKDSQEYIAKVYHEDKRPKKEIIEKIKAVQSPFVVEILDEGEYANRYFEILPYFERRDLQSSGKLDAAFLMDTVIPNINEGLFALHQEGIVHRDVKPNNIFYSNKSRHVILGDFGISSYIDSHLSVRMTTASRTLGYSAPETGQGIISKKVDYYSFGITLLHLATGRDPFQGMTEPQVLMATLNYKLSIPSSIDPRMANLIKGLTIKEPKERWGYAEVQRWINKEHVPINEKRRNRPDVIPYMFEGEEHYELSSLALALASHWEEGKKHLYRGFITDHIKQFGQDLASKAMDCEEETNEDIGLFKVIYILDPKAPLCWHGDIFMDLFQLRDKITSQLPEKNNIFWHLFKSGAFNYYLHFKGFESSLILECERLLDEFKNSTNEESVYYKLALTLQSTGQKPVFKFYGLAFSTPEEIVEYFYEDRLHAEELSEILLNSTYFFEWLAFCGYERHIKEWKKISGMKR